MVASMKRQALPGEFLLNLHRGGSSSLIQITPEERLPAARTAKIMSLMLLVLTFCVLTTVLL